MKAKRLLAAILTVTLATTAMPATSSASTPAGTTSSGSEGVVTPNISELQARPMLSPSIAVMLQPPPATHFTRAVVQAQTPGPTTRMRGGHFTRKGLLVTAIVVTALIVTLFVVVPRD